MLAPTDSQVEQFLLLKPMLDSLLNEMRELSKKKQDGALNKLKVKMINRVLSDIKNVVSKEATHEYLDLLDDETLPNNSDAVLILGQYEAAMKLFEDAHYRSDGARWRWITKERPIR